MVAININSRASVYHILHWVGECRKSGGLLNLVAGLRTEDVQWVLFNQFVFVWPTKHQVAERVQCSVSTCHMSSCHIRQQWSLPDRSDMSDMSDRLQSQGELGKSYFILYKDQNVSAGLDSLQVYLH